MTAQILVVDDLEPNVKLLEAKLSAEYYDVITAMDGFEAIAQAKKFSPDIILLDVMMPQIDGFETCRRLKADPVTAHIPVVMVTALSDPSDRIQGLQAGADDFITKPIKEVQLLARVRSLVRIKMLIDELRLRGETSSQLAGISGEDLEALMDITGEKVMLVDDDIVQSRQVIERLEGQGLLVNHISEPEECIAHAMAEMHDMFIISTQLADMDGLRLCSQLRSNERTRYNPQLIMVDEDDEKTIIKGLEMGVNDYLVNPIDLNEMVCRVRTNLRRKKYQDALKSNYRQSVSMAITDALTGLYNRHYLNAHIEKLVRHAHEKAKPLACLMLDMDHFKQVNDSFGHDVGDEVLKELSRRIVGQTRSSNLVARFGGEEFVVLLPGADITVAREIAERIRQAVEIVPFKITHEAGSVNKTISIGVAALRLNDPNDSGESMMKRGDEALYQSKHQGRNRVTIAEDDALLSSSFSATHSAMSPEELEEVLQIAEQPIVSSLKPGISPDSNRLAKVQDVLYQPGIIETAGLAPREEPEEMQAPPPVSTLTGSGVMLPEPPRQVVNPAEAHGPITGNIPEAHAAEPVVMGETASIPMSLQEQPVARPNPFQPLAAPSGLSPMGASLLQASTPTPAPPQAPMAVMQPPPPQPVGLGAQVYAAEPPKLQPEPSMEFLRRELRPSFDDEDEVEIAPEDVVLGIKPSLHRKSEKTGGGLLDRLVDGLFGRRKEAEAPQTGASGISPAALKQTPPVPVQPVVPIRPVEAAPVVALFTVNAAPPSVTPPSIGPAVHTAEPEAADDDFSLTPPWQKAEVSSPVVADAVSAGVPAPEAHQAPQAVQEAVDVPLHAPVLASPPEALSSPWELVREAPLAPPPESRVPEAASPLPPTPVVDAVLAPQSEWVLETKSEPVAAMPLSASLSNEPVRNPFLPQESPPTVMQQAATPSQSAPLFGTASQMRPIGDRVDTAEAPVNPFAVPVKREEADG